MAENLHWTIGDVTITRIVESVSSLPSSGVLVNADDDTVASHASWLRPHFVDDDGQFVLSIHALAIAAADRKIIVDTCVGEHQLPGMEALSRHSGFLTDLADAGFPREQVDTVICTHLHFDHVGWNTMLDDGAWVPTFPNARYLLCEDEWKHWQTEEVSPYTTTLGDAVQPVIDAGLADLVAADHAITDEVRLESTPGHTPGHVSVRIDSGGQHALITGDFAHHPVQFAETEWFSVADSDSAGSSATRRRVVDELRDSGVLVIGTHFAPPCAGHLVTAGNGCRFAAVPSEHG
jgi:glyoxylase-like metal-dependent hydrolase (beta-lactamase superfamily II)